MKSIFLLLCLLGPTAYAAPSLEDLNAQSQRISKLEWAILSYTIHSMRTYDYPSKPSFRSLNYDKKQKCLVMSFEVRDPFLSNFSSKKSVIEELKNLCEMEKQMIQAAFPVFDSTSDDWLRIVFRQQGGGNGGDIAVYSDGKLTVTHKERLSIKRKIFKN